MIRINLNRNRAQTGAQGASTTAVNFSSLSSGDNEEQRGALRNFFILFLGVAALLLYEKFNSFSLNDSDLILVGEYTQLSQQLEKDKGELDKYKGSEADAKTLEDKLAIIKKLSRVRLREVKALDYIQEIIPEKVWLRQISFDQEAVRISGYSILDEDLSNFIQSLDRSTFFQNVVLTQAAEMVNQSGSYKQFDISARLETLQ